MRRLAIAAAIALAGCVSTSQVGPYVKHVARNGDWLVIHKCIIVLEDKELSEQSCTVEQLPLAALSQVPMQPQPFPPAAPAPR